jgi:hypothetical protein
MQVDGWNTPITIFSSSRMNDTIQGSKSYGEISGVIRNATWGGTQYREKPIYPSDGAATHAGLPLITREGVVAKIEAAGALKKITSKRSHVGQLAGSCKQK